MLCFIDEVGDHWVQFDKHSSKYFTVAMVIFPDDEEAYACDKKIMKMQKSFGRNHPFEFHFTKNTEYTRKQFIEVISQFDFFYYAFIIDKKLCKELWYSPKHSFYEYVADLICEYAKESLDNARIIIDEWGGEYFKNRLSTLIKRGLNTAEKKCIKKLTTGNSCKEPLLQVADYIVGIVHREYDEEKSLKGEYRKMIQHKCVKIVVRPDVSQQEDKTD